MTDWMKLVMKVKAAHPKLDFKDVLIKAKKMYKK